MRFKLKPLTHEQRAIARVQTILAFGEVLVFSDHRGGVCTAGRWTPAVGPRDRFAVYGYGRAAEVCREGLSAEAAAGLVVTLAGPGRARDAALAADRRAGRKPARVVVGAVRRGRPEARIVYEP